MVLEKTLESPLNYKETQPVHSKGDQPWVFFGRNDAKAETPILFPGKCHGQKSLVGYSPWGHKELDTTERLHFSLSAFFIVQLSHPYMTTEKTIALTRWTFVGKVMSLLLNMLSRLVITFLPMSKHLLISWLQSQIRTIATNLS